MSNPVYAAQTVPLDNIFVGREKQIELINNEYEKLLKGNSGIVTIVGMPGIGKTYLVEHTLNQFNNTTYMYGKYRKNDKQTLVALAEILEQITSSILTLPKKALDNIINELNRNIGEDMVLLSAICNDLKRVFDIKKSVKIENFNKLKYRIKNAIYSFISIVSNYLFPLIIYMDDLQWADQLSIDIIRTIVNKKEMMNVLIIISFRINEVSEYAKKLVGTLKEKSCFIHLEKLNHSNIDHYIRQVFNDKLDNKEHLVKLINGLTSGNPFYVKEILKILLEENALRYSPENKSWNLYTDGINDFFLTDNMELILKNKIKDEKQQNGYIMELLSCLDGQVNYDILKLICSIDEKQLNICIDNLVESALIIKTSSNNKLKLLFSHDIIYKLIDNNIEDRKREGIHYTIAKTMWQDDNLEVHEKKNFIVSHLIRCSVKDINEDGERWIELLYEVGYLEKMKASIDAALGIFEFAQKLFLKIPSIDRILFVKLHLELAECLFLYNRIDECEKIMDYLTKNFTEKEAQISIKRKQIYLYQYKRDHKMVLKTGSEILKQLKFKFGKHRMIIDLIQSMYFYRPAKLQKIADAPKVTDDNLMLVIEVLTLMNVSAALTNDSLTAPIGLSASLVAAKYGDASDSLIGYSSYCYVMYLILKDYKNAEKFADIIAKISEETSIMENKSVVYFLLGGYLSHWCKSLQQSDDYLIKSIYYGERTGDFSFVGYSIATSVTTKFSMGMNIDDIQRFIDKCKMNYPEMDQYVTKYVFEVTTKHINDLKQGFDDYNYEAVASKYELLTPLETISEEEIMFQKMLFMNKIDAGYQLTDIVTPKIKISYGLLSSMELIFNSSLFKILMHNQLSESEKRKNLRLIKKLMNMIKHWVDIYKENYHAKYLLVRAQYKILILNDISGAELFNEAIASAVKNDNLYIEATASILAARHYKENVKLKKFYAQEGVKALREWGADFICSQIKKEFQIEEEKKDTKSKDNSVKKAKQDEVSITKFYDKIQDMDEDETARYLLHEIMDNKCADYCSIIYEKDRELFLKHEKKLGKNAKTYSDFININHISHIAHKVIRYAGRTGKDIIIDSNNQNAIFAIDSHIAESDKIFIACIAIKYHDVLIGIMYLEKYNMPIDQNKLLYIKSLIPAIIAKQTQIKNVNIKNIIAPKKNQDLLTKRELELLKLVAEGKSNQEISEHFNITLGTTKKHISSILAKLDTVNRIKAVIKAKEQNLI